MEVARLDTGFQFLHGGLDLVFQRLDIGVHGFVLPGELRFDIAFALFNGIVDGFGLRFGVGLYFGLDSMNALADLFFFGDSVCVGKCALVVNFCKRRLDFLRYHDLG